MKTISIESFETMGKSGGSTEVIDVRSPSEFASGHIPGAINIPLEEVHSRIGDLDREAKIVTVCETGRRASMAAEFVSACGLDVQTLEGSTAAWRVSGRPLVSSAGSSWSLDRQVRLGAGALVLAGTLLGFLAHPAWFVLSGFVGAGLTFAGITNVCGMANVLRKMPWNQPKPPSGSTSTEAAR